MKKLTILFCLSIMLMLGCVSIPKETVALSESLGAALGETERAHVELLHYLFKEKREEIDNMLDEVWIPKFSEEFYSIPKVKAKWNDICENGTPEDKLKFVTTVGVRIQKKINAKRNELMYPLDETEQIIAYRLSDHYNKMRVTNTALTNFVSSAADVKDQQMNVMKVLGLEQKALDKSVSSIFNMLDNVNGGSSYLENGEESTDLYLNNINTLIKSLKSD